MATTDVAQNLDALLQRSDYAHVVLNRLVQSGGEFDLFLTAILEKMNANNAGLLILLICEIVTLLLCDSEVST